MKLYVYLLKKLLIYNDYFSSNFNLIFETDKSLTDCLLNLKSFNAIKKRLWCILAYDRILARMNRNIGGGSEPPQANGIKCPVPEVDPSLFLDKRSLIYALHADFVILVDFSK